jgi:uncharacterized Zn-finger protein
MTLKDMLGSSGAAIAALALWFISSAFSMVLLNQIDGIVHGDLYHYGLQFSLSWATGYWALERSIYVILTVSMVFGGVVLGFSVLNRGNEGKPISVHPAKPVNGRISPAMRMDNPVALNINCPSCKKIFTKPLTMLDFSTGKANLVNVCPYCSHILGNAGKAEKDDIHIAGPEKEVIEEE